MRDFRITYVLYNERPNSGLVRTQVISLLKEIRRLAPEFEIALLAYWQPWVGWKFRSEIDQLGRELRSAGIELRNSYGAVIPSRHFMYRAELFPVLHRWGRFLLARSLPRGQDVIHCRGYFPSFIAAELKPESGYKLIFDMRSIWPKEHVSIGTWTTSDEIYHLWDGIETFTLGRSDAAVGVSPAMLEHVAEKNTGARPVEIPIAVDTDVFHFDEESRAAHRRELGWSDRRVIAYQGSLGLLNANIEEVAEYFGFISKVLPAVRFLILTSNRTVDIREILHRHGLGDEHFAIRHPADSRELAGWLSSADAGIHAMSPGPDSATRLGAKVVEYLSCGLPVIVNRWVGAAAALVSEADVGTVIDITDPEAAGPAIESLFARSDELRRRAREIAVERFSVAECAARYIQLYRHIVDEGGPRPKSPDGTLSARSNGNAK